MGKDNLKAQAYPLDQGWGLDSGWKSGGSGASTATGAPIMAGAATPNHRRPDRVTVALPSRLGRSQPTPCPSRRTGRHPTG